MLHAWKLGFFHPRTNDWMEFEAPLPSDFASRLHTEPSMDTTPPGSPPAAPFQPSLHLWFRAEGGRQTPSLSDHCKYYTPM